MAVRARVDEREQAAIDGRKANRIAAIRDGGTNRVPGTWFKNRNPCDRKETV